MEFEIREVAPATLSILIGIAIFCLAIPALALKMRPILSRRAAIPMYLGIGVGVIVAAIFAWFAVGQARSTIEIAGGELRLNVPIYSRAVPLARIAADGIGPVTLSPGSGYAYATRTNGLGLPGYQLGWFRTRERGRVLVAVTTPDVLAIPTLDDYTLLVSVEEPDRVRRALEAAARSRAAAP